MSLENPAEEILIATEKKDENESQKSMSDGEILDDDDVEDVKPTPINIPVRKLQKNFRARKSDSDDDEEEEGAIVERKSDKNSDEAKKLDARLVNGDEKYLQSVRKKIINELNEKDDARRSERYFNDRRSGNFHQNRFNNNRRDNRFRPNDSFRRNNISRPPIHDRRENGKREIPADTIEIRGRYRLLYFPKNIIKHTNTTPSISYAENPQSHHLKEDRKEKKSKRDEDNKKKEKFSKDKRRSRSKRRNESKERIKDSSKIKDETPKQEKSENDEKSPQKDVEKPLVEVKLTEENTEERTPELPTEIDENKEEHEPEREHEEEEEQQEEKIKFEPIIIERKTIRKIEKPKVNIFLEDSDEVDEFENANVITTLEVKSKWSSPEPEKIVENNFEDDNDSNTIEIVPKSIENKFNNEKMSKIPEVVESPEKSPITPMTDSIFDSSSISMSKSPTPKPVKNVCSFLSDIESEGYLSGFSLGSGLYSDDDDDDEDNSKLTDNLELNTGSLFSKNPEPDTTFDKLEDKEKKESNDDDSDSDESETSSSSESSSDSSSSSESEDESSDSSDDETTAIVSRFGGFGRFDATSIPMVTQIKPVLTQTIAGQAATETTVVQSRFQPHQSIIRPPQLVTNLTRPPLYPATPVIATPTTPMPFATPFGTGQFPVPFKIYSLKDAGNSGIIFPSTPVVTPVPAPSSSTPIATVEKEKEKEKEKVKESEKDREREKRPEKRERERHRSRSHSRDRDRDRKRHKDDRRDTERRKTPPPKRRSPSPVKRKYIDDKRDLKRRDSSPRHSNSHNSRSRHSPIRRSRRSRSRSPVRSSINSRPRTPPHSARPRTPPPKLRRISPRRSHSRSPPAKFRRSSSPVHRNHHHSRSSPSPIYRRSPRRRYSPSPIKDQNHIRRTPSRTPDGYDRFDRRSYSPSFRGKIDSPNGYKLPDSTISDTELERQQQFTAQNDYYSWNSSMPQQHSPRRQNLDDRIHRMLSDSPTSGCAQQQMYAAPDGSFPYPQIHDNHLPPPSHNNYHQGLYYPDIYSHNQSSSFMPPPSSIDSRYSSHNSFDDSFNAFPSPRYVNNSNLVEITQQKRERQRAGSSQVAVQVGNCLEIVPSSKIPTPPMQEMTKSKSFSPEEIKQQSERREQAKLRRKADRERKRMAKFLRKEKLRQEIQKYFDAGINIEDSDDETLIKLRPVNVNAVAERGIIKKSNEKEAAVVTEKKEKRVLFTDGVHAGETSSDGENAVENEQTKKLRIKRKKIRKRRLNMLIKERKNASTSNELDILVQKQDQLIDTPPPDPPPNSPPPHLKQPQLKVITADMFAQFAVNHEPMYYHLHKLQVQQQEQQAAAAAAANAYHHMPSRNNSNDRYRYNNKHQPPPPASSSLQQPQSQYMQQQRFCIPSKPLNSLDPRINQQRSIEKSFA